MYYIGDEEISALKQLFEKKRLYRYQGAYVSECDSFESEFSAFIGSRNSLLLTSGTNALVAALLSAGLQRGDEVIIPAYTFFATASAVVQAGGIPIVANVNENLSLDFGDAEKRISEKTKAVILVHMDGLVADVNSALAFCNKHNLMLIEDVAQAVGSSLNGKFCGTYGKFGCFSLNENKQISCGEGGIVITDDRAGYERAFCLHDGAGQFNPNKKDFFKETQSFIGLSMRVSEIQGAIMRVQLRRLPSLLNALRQRKKIYQDVLAQSDSFRVVSGYSTEECASSLHLQFNDSESVAMSKNLSSHGPVFSPVTARPAHAVWKWNHLLGERAHIQSAANPYLNTEKKYSYPVADFLSSIDVLTRTVKMDIDIELSLEQTEAHAQKIKSILLS